MNRREMVYQPLGQRVCTTTHEQMDEKLQRRMREIASKALLKSGETVNPDTGEIHVEQSEPKPDGRSEPSPTRLVWTEKAPGAHYIETNCARYRISGAKSQGAFRYSAWRCAKAPGAMPEPLGCTDTSEAAKQLCEEHVAAQTVKT